mgnify:CR=1 FL=1
MYRFLGVAFDLQIPHYSSWNRGIGKQSATHLEIEERIDIMTISKIDRKASKVATRVANEAAKAAFTKAVEEAKQERIAERVANLTEFNIGEQVKTFIKIDPTALALSRTILRDLKTRWGKRKVNGNLATYAKSNGVSALSTMTVAIFEQEVLGE